MKAVAVVQYKMTLPSVANLREHWSAKAKRTKMQRLMAWAEMRQMKLPPLIGPVVVTLTRIGSKQLDTDNLASAFKATRDGVADFFKVPDNDPRIEWRYAQEFGEVAYVRIEVAS